MTKEELIPILYVNPEGIEMVKCVKRTYCLAEKEEILSSQLLLARLRLADAWGDEKEQVIARSNPLFQSNNDRIDEIIA